jgi:hypothetical protein
VDPGILIDRARQLPVSPPLVDHIATSLKALIERLK